MKCVCGSSDIDFQEASGNAVCCGCGRIIEENTIVSSIEFEETGDRSTVVGQFVSAGGTKPMRANNRIRNRFSSNGESRQLTLQNARRAIQQVASIMKLPLIFVDRAHNLYRLALQSNFMFGRQQSHVVATCLYTICRLEKSPNLLIDFSDALQVNVYTLGKSFLHFIKTVKMQQALQVVDPALYIHRFANRFNLGDKQNSVITMALRIITRMKKDWIITGRRPDSICAFALLTSMKCHGIDKSYVDVAKVFRITPATLIKRINEFASTPAAQLTVQQFNNLMPIHPESSSSSADNLEFDPPCFIRSMLKELSEDTKLAFAFDDTAARDSDDEQTYDLELQATATISGVDVKIPIPEKKKRKISALMETKLQANELLYANIHNDLLSSSQDPTLHSDLEIKPAEEKQSFSVDEDEISGYMLLPEEQEKRSAIFEKTFRQVLDDRINRKLHGGKSKSRKNGAVLLSSHEKKSSKINYEALRDIHDDESMSSQPVKTRKTISIGSSLSRQTSTIGPPTIPQKPDTTTDNNKEEDQFDNDDDLIYDDHDNYDEYDD